MGKKQDDFDKRIEKFIGLLQNESGAPDEACKKEAYQWIRLFSGLRRADERLRNREQKWQAAVDILPGMLQSIEKHAEAFDDLLSAGVVRELQDHITRFYREASVSKVEKQAKQRECFQQKRGGQFDPLRHDRLTVVKNEIAPGWKRLTGKKASIQTPRDHIDWTPEGPFLEILEAFFLLFEIHISPNTLKEDFYRSERKWDKDRRKKIE